VQNFSDDARSNLRKIIYEKDLVTKTEHGHFSAASKMLNIMKNKQNRLYIKSVMTSGNNNDKKWRIYKYMKANEADIVHLNVIKSCFLEADEERVGRISKA
jgi:hypothetical protein